MSREKMHLVRTVIIVQNIAESAYRAARNALNGVDPSGGALYYFNPATAISTWV